MVLVKILSSCMLRGSARSLWRLPRTVSALRYASGTSLHGKRLDKWTREEVARSLQEVEEMVARGGTPNKKTLGLLLAPIRHFKDSEGLARILEVMRRAKVSIDSGVASALVTGLAEAGRVEDMRTVLQEMQGKLRLQGVVAVLALACRERDVELAKEYLERWDVLQPLPVSLGEQLVRLTMDTGDRGIMQAVFRILRNTGQKVDEKMAEALRQWAASQPEPYSCEETTVSHTGVCASCGHRLEKGLTDEAHYQLLDAMTKAINVEGLGFSPELISNLSRLNDRLCSTAKPYKAVVDGLNVSHHTSSGFSVMQVLDVVNQLVGVMGGPVLVVARKHLASAMDDLPSFYHFVPSPQDFHVFTTHINEISDDICVIYAALKTGPECYYVSNDYMSDYVSRLSAGHAQLFRSWQASRQITVDSNGIRLLYPADHNQLVQWTEDGWHVPVRDSAVPSSADSWMHEGRRVDYSGTQPSLNNAQQWLCIRSSR